MKNTRIARFFSLLLTFVLCLSLLPITAFAAEPSAPTNPHWEGTYAMWDAPASGEVTQYVIWLYRDGDLINQIPSWQWADPQATSYDCSGSMARNGHGKYTFEVTAQYSDGSATSEMSPEHDYTGPLVQATYSFSPGEGSGTMPNVNLEGGSTYPLPSCTFTAPAGKTFKARENRGNEYAPGYNFKVKGNDELFTALWKDNAITYTVTSAAITGVTEPVAGAVPSTSGITVSSAPEGSLEASPSIFWRVKNGDSWDGFTGNFEEGKEYSITVSIECKATYSFASDFSATVNGNDATEIAKPNDVRRNIIYSFGPLGAATVKHPITVIGGKAYSDSDKTVEITEAAEGDKVYIKFDDPADGKYVSDITYSEGTFSQAMYTNGVDMPAKEVTFGVVYADRQTCTIDLTSGSANDDNDGIILQFAV